MASSDAVLAATSSAPAADGSDAWSRRSLALALILPWWLPFLGNASSTFYKELLTLMLGGFAGVIATVPARRADEHLHPLTVTALVLALVVALQCMFIEGVWRRGSMTLVGLLAFWVCLRLGVQLRERLGDKAFAWLATGVTVAALGSCAFAALQMFGFDELVPGVVRRAGSSRLTGNVAQSNQFADLLWVGAIGVVWLTAARRFHVSVGLALIVLLEFFAVTTGSRTVWLYIAVALIVGIIALRRSRRAEVRRRLAIGLIVVAIAQAVLSIVVTGSGLLTPLQITSAEARARDADESNAQRLWFWRSGASIAIDRPVLGVGVGRLAGAMRERVATHPEAPSHGADAHAHNLFVQVAAELGLPAAIALAVGLAIWLFTAVQRVPESATGTAALVMSLVMLVHANLEHPFSYLYVLALFGVVASQVPWKGVSLGSGTLPSLPPQTLRLASFALILCGVAAYVSYMPVERATQVLGRRVAAGAPPQPDQELAVRLNAIQDWSPYTDYAETLGLMVSVPNERTASGLAARCERAVAFGPTPYLLARCAADLHVAGQRERAANFVLSLCRAYPEAAGVLQQSTAFVAETTPSAAGLASTCDVAPGR